MHLLKEMPVILVVDDERAICDLIAAVLEGEGYRVQSALNVHKATELFQQQPAGIGLLLTDLSMPFTSGIELIRELKGIRPELPVVAMSADFQRWSKDLIGIPCLDKPFSVEPCCLSSRSIGKAPSSTAVVTNPRPILKMCLYQIGGLSSKQRN